MPRHVSNCRSSMWWSTGLAVASAAALLYLDQQQRQRAEDENCIYLDYNGTTPIYPDVLEQMMPYLQEHYGNPSSSHIMGKEPRRAIDRARTQILALLGASPETPISSIWFTGSGTEADNLAIALALQSTSGTKIRHIVTCNVEHPAIDLYLSKQAGDNVHVTRVPVQPNGCVRAEDVIAALRPETILVTLMLANNESGALQPVREVAQECRRRNIMMHTDAAQAAGKVSVDVNDLGNPDMVSIVGHKLGAPKGIACLYVREGCWKEGGRNLAEGGVLLIGGGQEHGRRAGTENTPCIVGLGYAALKAKEGLVQNSRHMESMRGRLLMNLQRKLGKDYVRANGPEEPSLRLPNTLSVGFRNIHSGDLLREIGDLVAASAGATCHGANSVSSVLRAMQVPDEFARGTLRLSLGPKTTARQVDRAATIIADAVQQQWGSSTGTKK